MSALDKYLRLAGAFLGNPGNPNTNTPDPADKKYFIVKKGGEQVLLKKENIAYLFTEKKVLFAVDGDNRRYILEHQHLSGVSSQLNNHFYRANRKYILNINFIQKFRTINRVKILVEVALPVSQDIIISQENATEFKNWIKEI